MSREGPDFTGYIRYNFWFLDNENGHELAYNWLHKKLPKAKYDIRYYDDGPLECWLKFENFKDLVLFDEWYRRKIAPITNTYWGLLDKELIHYGLNETALILYYKSPFRTKINT